MRNKKGFTLVELLLFMALTGIFLTLTSQIMQWAVDSRLESAGSSAVDINAVYIYNRLLYDIRRSSAISQPGTIGQTSNSLGLTISGQNYTYSNQNNKLVLTNNGATQPITDTDVILRNFSVTRTGSVSQTNGVKINIEIESQDRTTGNVSQSRVINMSEVLR